MAFFPKPKLKKPSIPGNAPYISCNIQMLNGADGVRQFKQLGDHKRCLRFSPGSVNVQCGGGVVLTILNQF